MYAVDRQAQRHDCTVVNDLPASNDLLREAFETEPNVENAAINLGSNGYLFFEVKEIIAARDRTLDEVREKVLADWTGEEQDRLLSAKVAELEKRLRDGATLDEIAAELGLTKQTKQGLTRGDEDAEIGAAAVTAAFAIPQGGVASAIAPWTHWDCGWSRAPSDDIATTPPTETVSIATKRKPGLGLQE